MKHFFLIALFLLIARSASAQTVSPTKLPNKLDDLKDRLATKVAQMREVVKNANNGKIISTSLTGATLETATKSLKIEFADEVKVIEVTNGKRNTLETDVLKKDDQVTVFGSYDATLDILKASVIVRQAKQTVERMHGTVTASDPKNFTVTLQTPEGRSVTVHIEKNTKTSQWTTADGITKSGFSKINIGDTVHVTGTPNTKEQNTISALRVLSLGNFAAATSTPEASPSGSL